VGMVPSNVGGVLLVIGLVLSAGQAAMGMLSTVLGYGRGASAAGSLASSRRSARRSRSLPSTNAYRYAPW
jgi:hypothetical protein